jgi:hypothetical protein
MMNTLLRLPLILLELALRGAVETFKDLLRRDAEPAVPSPDVEAAPAAAAGARREAERVAAEEAAARRPAARPSAARRRTKPAPRPRPVAPAPEPPEHVSEDAEQVASFGPADAPGPLLEVEPPWEGYDRQSASEVVQRVRQGDEATRAVVLLYERTHKGRKSVLDAAQASSS